MGLRVVQEGQDQEKGKEKKREDPEVTDQGVETEESTEREVGKEIVITSQNHHGRHIDPTEIGTGIETGRGNIAADVIRFSFDDV